jgi:hypothetical protein
MKHAAFYVCIFFIACSNSNSADQNQLATNSAKETAEANTSAAANPGNDDIIGEWKLTMWIRDNNLNNKIEEDEKADAITQMNDYMKLNADGSAVFSQVKIKGRYEIKLNSDGTRKYLNLFDEANSRYQKGEIISVTKTELTLSGTSLVNTFTIWKRL